MMFQLLPLLLLNQLTITQFCYSQFNKIPDPNLGATHVCRPDADVQGRDAHEPQWPPRDGSASSTPHGVLGQLTHPAAPATHEPQSRLP